MTCAARGVVTLCERGCELHGWHRHTRAARAAAVPGVRPCVGQGDNRVFPRGRLHVQ